MKKILKTLFFLVLVISASCTKEDNQLGNGKVNVNGIGYKFNEVATKSNKNTEERVIGSSALELDDKYILIGELVETNEDIITSTKLPYSYEPVTAVKVLTFYKQDAKTENRLQNLNMTDKTFELPPEGGCDVIFLGNVGSNTTSVTIDNNNDNATGTSVNSGTNLCYLIKSYGNSIPATEDLSNMIPLFAQIGEIVVPASTTDNWAITSISNLKITAGCQNSSGSIAIDKSSVSYTKTGTNYSVAIGNFTSNTTTAKNLNVIPNGNNFVITADVKLTNKTNSVNLSFDFNQPIVSGKRYKLNFSVRRNGIIVKFYTNTQQLGFYSRTFDNTQQATLKANNSSSIATTESDGTVYYKYGSTIKLPTNPQKASDAYYNPNDYMVFYRWSKQQDCKSGLINSTSVVLNESNFPDLKTSDVVKLYAYYHPIYYYWNGSSNAYNSGVYGLSYNQIYNLYLNNSLYSTSSIFSNTPTSNDYKTYFGYSAKFFYDSGYTEDGQQGYWVQKWSKSKYNTPRPVINSSAVEIVQPTGTIANGNFSGTGYNKSDFFFLPILGFYYPQMGETPYALNNNGAGGATDGAFWSKNITEVPEYNNYTGQYTYNFVSQGISLLENGKGIRLYGKNGTSVTVGYNVVGFSPIGNSSFTGRNALLAQWPDNTY